MLKSSKARVLEYLFFISLGLFVIAAVVLGEIFKAYDAVWWWDDMLHTVSGVLMGLAGLLLVYVFNAKYSLDIRPLFVAIFTFCFAMTVGVLWEVYEFGMDYFFATTMQQWNLSADALVIGKEYQGIGLRDTMADLMLASIGALAAAIFAYLSYKLWRPMTLQVMRRVFPWVKQS